MQRQQLDREQLSHYAMDAEYNMTRRSVRYLLFYAAWPTERSLQNLVIAWNDYLYSGDIRMVKSLYKKLKSKIRNGKPITASTEDDFWLVDNVSAGKNR